jgi:hypothetical protein
MICASCQDRHWVCEEHPDKPVGHGGCKGAGDPCPVCNPASADRAPALPPDFEGDTVIDLLDRVGRKHWSR